MMEKPFAIVGDDPSRIHAARWQILRNLTKVVAAGALEIQNVAKGPHADTASSRRIRPTTTSSSPVARHQIFPGAAQGAANSRHGRDEQIYFASLNPPHIPDIDVNQFGQPLLSHTQRSSE